MSTPDGCTADAVACESCAAPMLRPFVLDADEAPLCEECAGFMCSLGCGRVCGPKDRLPFQMGVVHFGCVGKWQRSIGYERASTLILKRGPKFPRPLVIRGRQ